MNTTAHIVIDVIEHFSNSSLNLKLYRHKLFSMPFHVGAFVLPVTEVKSGIGFLDGQTLTGSKVTFQGSAQVGFSSSDEEVFSLECRYVAFCSGCIADLIDFSSPPKTRVFRAVDSWMLS